MLKDTRCLCGWGKPFSVAFGATCLLLDISVDDLKYFKIFWFLCIKNFSKIINFRISHNPGSHFYFYRVLKVIGKINTGTTENLCTLKHESLSALSS